MSLTKFVKHQRCVYVPFKLSSCIPTRPFTAHLSSAALSSQPNPATLGPPAVVWTNGSAPAPCLGRPDVADGRCDWNPLIHPDPAGFSEIGRSRDGRPLDA